ncbi:MAG: hypothetical protein ABDH23_05640 [Endomicrobiia bacterium]
MKILYKSLLLLLFIKLSIVCYAEVFKRNSLYLEIGGTGIGLSINAETKVLPYLALRGGVSSAILGFGFPLSISYLSGADKFSHHFEAGVSFSYFEVLSIFGEGTFGLPLFGGIFGYRYQPKKGGFLFRVVYTPLVRIEEKERYEVAGEVSVPTGEKYYVYHVLHWGGISFGFSF